MKRAKKGKSESRLALWWDLQSGPNAPIGVGVSLSLGTQPDPIALGKSPQGPDFIEYAGAVDVSLYHKEVTELKQAGIPLLYHPSCLNLCGPWPNPSAWLKQVNTHVKSVGSAWLAQDVAICFVGDQPGYSIDLGYFIPPILTCKFRRSNTTRHGGKGTGECTFAVGASSYHFCGRRYDDLRVAW